MNSNSALSWVGAAFAFMLSGCGVSGGIFGPEESYNYISYTANSGSDLVTVASYDPQSGYFKEIQKIATGPEPVALVLAPDHKFLYVANTGDATIWSYAINPETGELRQANISQTASAPEDLLIDSSGRNVYVAHASNQISRFAVNPQIGSLQQVGLRAVASHPSALALDEEKQVLFVARQNVNLVAAFSVAGEGLALASERAVGIWPNALAVRSGTLYVGNYGSNSIGILSYDSAGVLSAQQSVEVSGGPVALVLDPQRSVLYASLRDAGVIAVFSLGQNGSLTAEPEVTGLVAPESMQFEPQGRFAFVACGGAANSVSVFSRAGSSMILNSTTGADDSPKAIVALRLLKVW